MISTVCRRDHLRYCTYTLPDCCGLTAAPHQTLKGVGGGGQAALITLFQLCFIFNYIVLSWYLRRSCQFCHNPAHSRNLHLCTNPKENIFCLDIYHEFTGAQGDSGILFTARIEAYSLTGFILNLKQHITSLIWCIDFFWCLNTKNELRTHSHCKHSECNSLLFYGPPTSRVILIYIDTNFIV